MLAFIKTKSATMFFLFSALFFLLSAFFFFSFPSLVWFWNLSRPESLPFDALSPKWQQISLGTFFNNSTRHKYILFWKVNISSQRLISYFADALPKHLQSLPFLKAGSGLSQTWMKLKYFTKCTTESAEDEFTDAAQKRNLLLKLPVKTQHKAHHFALEVSWCLTIPNLQILSNLKNCLSKTISAW